MASKRDAIKLTDDELRDFLDEQMVMQVATFGPRGWPHMMPLWFVREDADLVGWTFAKAQKAKNLERDPRATVGIETGVKYEELRGVMFECDVELERDTDKVASIGVALADRYMGGAEEFKEFFRKQAPKRVGLRFVPRRTASWDHRKLGGNY